MTKQEKLLDWWVNYEFDNNAIGVKFEDIPSEYKDSFNTFMFGKTIYIDEENNHIAYSWDVGQWIYMNTSTVF